MKKQLFRVLISVTLLLALIFVILRPPSQYYPEIVVDVVNGEEKITLDFLFEQRASLEDCERLSGSVIRALLAACADCQLKQLRCSSALEAHKLAWLDDKPLPLVTGRMINGTVGFQANQPALALASCMSTQTQSATSKHPIRCYPENTPRPKSPAYYELGSINGLLFLAAAIAAWLAGWIIIRYEHLHAHLSHDHVASGPQKYHTQPTPRIGGLSLIFGMWAATALMSVSDAGASQRAFTLLLLASLPAFLAGLVEDVTKKVGVLERLLLTMLSGAVAASLLGAVLTRLDIPGVDLAFQWLPFAIVFTVFAVGGIANAFNIVDGYNGLAGGYALIALAAIAFVANQLSDSLVFTSSLMLAGSLLGYLAWNWPRGRIFLGDGGAYLLGFLMAELAILLVIRNPGVSAWFPLLLLIYPIFETFFSIYRRKFRLSSSPGEPDNQHLHQLIHDSLLRNHSPTATLNRNSQVAPYFWTTAVILVLLACNYWHNTAALIATALGFCLLYITAYRFLAKRAN